MIITLYFLNGFLNFNFFFGHFPCPVAHMNIELDGCSQGWQQEQACMTRGLFLSFTQTWFWLSGYLNLLKLH